MFLAKDITHLSSDFNCSHTIDNHFQTFSHISDVVSKNHLSVSISSHSSVISQNQYNHLSVSISSHSFGSHFIHKAIFHIVHILDIISFHFQNNSFLFLITSSFHSDLTLNTLL
jgi:hypothetical protein